MSKYWAIAEKNPEGASRPFYVVAPTAGAAKEKLEQITGPLPSGYVTVTETTADAIPEGEDWL